MEDGNWKQSWLDFERSEWEEGDKRTNNSDDREGKVLQLHDIEGLGSSLGPVTI